MNQASKSPLGGTRTTARAFFVCDRLNTSGLERGDVLATTPLAFRVNENGVAVLFRYGVVVLIGLIQNAMVLVKVDPYWVQFLLGALILAAVWFNRYRAVRVGES